MSPSKIGCLLVLLALALASAKPLDHLVQDTRRIAEEMDIILERVKMDPLAIVKKGPLAPHASSPAELAQQVPIGVIGGSSQSPLFNEPHAAASVSLMETAGRTSIDLKNTVEATLRNEPLLTGPEPEDGPFYAARAAWNRTTPGDIELRLRKLWPKPVVVEREKIQTADMHLNADEILPKDPDADVMLMHFNEKYGVFDDKGIPSSLPQPPDSDLLPANKQNLTKVQRDYTDVYDGANKFGFNMEKDSVEVLDKMLGSMWTKRWEYHASEAAAAEERAKARIPNPDAVPTFEIDPLFPAKQPNPDDRGESLLGNVYVIPNEPSKKDPIPFIENRYKFKPETSFYGPNVYAKARNMEHMTPPGPPEMIAPEYNAPNIPEPSSIKLIPQTPEPTNPHETIVPEIKGADIDTLNLVPAKLVKGLNKLIKK